jgi:putative salt-induced outer membrane protein YdiY
MGRTLAIAVFLTMLGAVSAAAADEVRFLNGDRLTGKILSATGGKIVIKTEAAGEVTADLSKVATFSTDEPVRIQVGERRPQVETQISSGPQGQVAARTAPDAPPQPLPIVDITAINPPLPAWHGSVALNGLFTTGNSETQQLGFTLGLSKRWEDDRLSFFGEYSYGHQRDPNTGVSSTSVDYSQAWAKYEHFFTPKLYGYGLVKFERDGVAGLNYRFSPSAGVGYQWVDQPAFKFSTEAGLAYVYEDYESTGGRDFWGPRLAYAVEWTPVQPLKLYHNLEYLPSFSDFTGDYLLNANAGLHAGVWRGLFTDLRIEYRYDSEPAPGRKKDDTRIILGAGWEF